MPLFSFAHDLLRETVLASFTADSLSLLHLSVGEATERLAASGEMEADLALLAEHWSEAGDRERYQTVYARARGSVAAPTLIWATPPASFARRSCNFSRS